MYSHHLDSPVLARNLYQSRSELDDERDTFIITYVRFLGFTVLIWDHMITFDDEVEFIWKAPKKLMSYLFLTNRYFTPAAYIVFLVSYLSPTLSDKECRKFVAFQGAMVLTSVTISSLMMLKRVRALYQDRPCVTYILTLALGMWFAVTLLDVTKAKPGSPSSVVHVCMVNIIPVQQSEKLATRLTSILFYITFDTLVFLLTLARALPFEPFRNRVTIMRKLTADGLLYYALIVSSKVAQAIMMNRATPGLENLLGEFNFLLQVTMMSRMTISLPKTHRTLTDGGACLGSHWEDAPSLPPIAFARQLREDSERTLDPASPHIAPCVLRASWDRSVSYER